MVCLLHQLFPSLASLLAGIGNASAMGHARYVKCPLLLHTFIITDCLITYMMAVNDVYKGGIIVNELE